MTAYMSTLGTYVISGTCILIQKRTEMILRCIACGIGVLASLVILGVIIYGIWAENKSRKDLIKEIKKRGITKVIIEE